MYYVIVPSELCARRKVFTKNTRLPDGRVVLTLGDLNRTRFSYGSVEIVNGDDLQVLMQVAPSQVRGQHTDAAEEE